MFLAFLDLAEASGSLDIPRKVLTELTVDSFFLVDVLLSFLFGLAICLPLGGFND